MNNNNLNSIANDLYILLISLQKKVFTPEELMKRFNLPPSHVRVLFYLIHHGACSISEIGSGLNISKPNMTPIIDKLESEGLLKRYNDPNDRRKIIIESTKNACAFLKEQELIVKDHLSTKISSLNEEELEKLNGLIKEMNVIVSKL